MLNFAYNLHHPHQFPPALTNTCLLDDFAVLINEFGLRYNKAIVCPENNSYGYATILKLQELKYPRLYYRKRKSVYNGDYVPKSSAETAGFNTNGKTRGTILAKLEEVIRNKLITINSLRLANEIKTFVWHNGRPQAMRSYNDDLVIATSIACWVRETALGVNQREINYNKALLKEAQ